VFPNFLLFVLTTLLILEKKADAERKDNQQLRQKYYFLKG